ncbi:hypothetical protein N0V92_013968, partial [Colletotrichum tropicale]
TSKVSPANDDDNNITATTITQQDASTTTSEGEKKAMPNSGLRPAGPGFGKLGDEEYELRNVDTPGSRDNAPGAGHLQQPYSDAVAGGDDNGSVMEGTATEYRTYKRRWFGLAQLTLLNVIVSWDVSVSHVVSLRSSAVSDTGINAS